MSVRVFYTLSYGFCENSNAIFTNRPHASIGRFSWILRRFCIWPFPRVTWTACLLGAKTTDIAIEKVLHVWNRIKITFTQTVKHLSLITFAFNSMFNERFQIAERRRGKVVWSCPGTLAFCRRYEIGRFNSNDQHTADFRRRIQMRFVIVPSKNWTDGSRKFISRDYGAFMGRFSDI